jgi:hypothetical protein
VAFGKPLAAWCPVAVVRLLIVRVAEDRVVQEVREDNLVEVLVRGEVAEQVVVAVLVLPVVEARVARVVVVPLVVAPAVPVVSDQAPAKVARVAAAEQPVVAPAV